MLVSRHTLPKHAFLGKTCVIFFSSLSLALLYTEQYSLLTRFFNKPCNLPLSFSLSVFDGFISRLFACKPDVTLPSYVPTPHSPPNLCALREFGELFIFVFLAHVVEIYKYIRYIKTRRREKREKKGRRERKERA
jgi:hypothetical protein